MTARKQNKKHSFVYKNGLSIAFFTLAAVTIVGQAYTGWIEHNKELLEDHVKQIEFISYLSTGHFIEATFENWESEFLQMALYVILTVKLRQIGSSESKKLDEPAEVDREPKPHPNAPWPVKKGGIALLIYKNSLSIALLVLFVISFALHAYGSLKSYNLEQQLKGLPTQNMSKFIVGSKLWFESFQNWQSEFLSKQRL